jgi:hypothetical protein
MGTFVALDARYHECRVVAVRHVGDAVDARLAVRWAEQYHVERAFDTGDGWVRGTLAGPLDIRLVYGSTHEARTEAELFHHWGSSGAELEVTRSVESQGLLVREPATGLFTGMRLGPAHLDEPEPDPLARS